MTHRTASHQLAVPVHENDHILGMGTARVTLVEYGDFECPACGLAYPIVKEVTARLGADVRFVFRHFPLTTVHVRAERAAESSEAADSQGRFWPMHDLLYEGQDELEDEDLIRYAHELELNTDQFVRELAEGLHRSKVRHDFMGGVRSGVNGTPTFFINEVRYDGPFDLDKLLNAIDDVAGEF